MDTLYTKDVDIICLVSSDCDFTPLVTRALADGKFVIGFGERKAPTAFVNSCSKFLFVEEVNSNSEVEPISGSKLKRDTKLITLIRQAIESVENDEGWAQLGTIGQHISNQASFDQRNYGYKKLSDLISAIDLFEMKQTHGSSTWVKDKRRAVDVSK